MDKESKQLVPWLTAVAFFGVAGIVVFFWIGAEDDRQKTASVLTSTQDDLKDIAHELDATKKELQRCQSTPKPTEYVPIPGDKCGEFLARCMEAIDSHIENVEAILR
jgi:hypothetical protein